MQSSFHLLFWGWLIFACSLSEFLLWKLTDRSNSLHVWLFVIPGVFVSLIYGFVREKREKMFTYGTAIHVRMWGAVSFWVLALVAHFGGQTVSGLAMPVAMIAGYLIPGYSLRKKGSHDTVQGA